MRCPHWRKCVTRDWLWLLGFKSPYQAQSQSVSVSVCLPPHPSGAGCSCQLLLWHLPPHRMLPTMMMMDYSSESVSQPLD